MQAASRWSEKAHDAAAETSPALFRHVPPTAVLSGADVLWYSQSLGHWGVLTGHSEPVHAVAWSPRSRGTVCFTAGRDSSLRIWDLAAGKALANLVTRPNVIHMAASQDGNYFSASTTDDVISVYDARTNKLMSSTLVPFETNSQEWTAAGHLDVACGKKGSEGGMLVRFSVNAAAPQPRQVSAPVAEALSSSSLAAATSRAVPPKQAVVTSLGGAGCGLTKVAEVPVLAGAARVLSRSLDGALVALAGVDSSVVLLDAATDTCVRSVDAGSGAVTSVDFSRDGCHLAVASRDSPIRIVRLCDGTTVREIAGTAARYVTAAWHPTKDLLAVISDDGTSPTKLRVLKC